MADQHHEDDDVAQPPNLAPATRVVSSPKGSERVTDEALVLECSRSDRVKLSGAASTSAASSPVAGKPTKRSVNVLSGAASTSAASSPVAGKPTKRSVNVLSGAASTSAASSPVAGKPTTRSGNVLSGAASTSAASTSAASTSAASSPAAGTSGARKRAAASMTSSSSSSKMPVRSRGDAPEEVEDIFNINDSGSELSSSDDDDDAVIAPSPFMGKHARELAVAEEEEYENMRLERLVDLNASPLSVQEEYAVMQDVHDEEWIRSMRGQLQGEHEVSVDVEGNEETPQGVAAEAAVSAPASPRVASLDADVYSWSDDFSNFTGQAETYLRAPGPQFQSQDPTEIFLRMWDRPIIEMIVTETNRYAWQIISKLSETGEISAHLGKWRDTTVEEIYTLFTILIYMSLCFRTKLQEYWTTGDLGMPAFRKLMSRHRFFMLTRFLHFVNNEDKPPGLSSYQKKISKIAPILTHCNNVFPSLYTPQRELSLDESLLLWKGSLSWVQSVRTKAARFGIKSYDLCEGTTGYLLRTLLYAGKDSSMHPAPIHGFENVTAKVVLELMDGFLDLGHSLFMGSWYNQLPLTRYLKSRATDVVGTISPRRAHVPVEIQSLNDRMLARGQQVARHCGDITLISWNDVKLVTTISTCHDDQHVPCRRAGQDVAKPLLVHDYNKYMGGVDRKDQMLSMYLIERKRKKKWYMKVFHRLLNTSLLNTFVIHRLNPMFRNLTHRDVRFSVAQGLVDRFSCPGPVQRKTPPTTSMPPPAALRLDNDKGHRPVSTPKATNRNRKQQARCQRCLAHGKRTLVTQMCFRCAVALCHDQCWLEYHTLVNLQK